MDLGDLYRDLIVEHKRSPRNFRELPDPAVHARGFNPVCGDRVTVYLDLDEDGTVRDAAFQGDGCAISVASASLMTEALKGRSRKEVQALFERMHGMLTGRDGEPDTESLGKLAALSGVRDFPVRVKCATLCWHTMLEALKGEGEQVTTE